MTSQRGENIPGTIYLIHLDRPYRHASHYLGWASDLDRRLAQHGTREGSPLLVAAKAAGITWTLARTWEGATRHRERQLKRQGGKSRMCPLCGVRPAGPTKRAVA